MSSDLLYSITERRGICRISESNDERDESMIDTQGETAGVVFTPRRDESCQRLKHLPQRIESQNLNRRSAGRRPAPEDRRARRRETADAARTSLAAADA